MHDIIIKQIDKIRPVNTSHNIGSKKILVSKKEIESAITQIAITQIDQSNIVENHVHETMDEHYIFRSGVCDMIVDNKKYKCTTGTYILVPAGAFHSLYAITNIEIITIGVAK